MLMTTDLSIEVYNEVLPLTAGDTIRKMVDESGLDEPFDWYNTRRVFLGRKGDEPVALVAYGMATIHHKTFPRFLHIIITPQYQHCVSGYKVLVRSEEILKLEGSNQVVAYFAKNLPGRDMKKKYATKFGYKHFCSLEDGSEWYYKDIH